MAGMIETWGYRPRTRHKRCYELALRPLTEGKVPEGTVAVFGTWTEDAFPHVWLVLPDGRIWEPVTATLDGAHEQIERHRLAEYPYAKTRYSAREAADVLASGRAIYQDLAELDRLAT